MALKICALASGSKGNCIFISGGNTSILIDAGISFSAICNGLKRVGSDISEISAVLVSHEHSDHVRSLSRVAEAITVYVHENAREAIGGRVCAAMPCGEEVFGDKGFTIGGIDITPFRVPHDAAYPVGFSFEAEGGKISVATDLGYMTRGVLNNLKGSDVVLLEANHDERLLKTGRYPEALKRRILGRNGHLSNEISALTVCELLAFGGTHTVILGHLSEENNRPELAYNTVAEYAKRSGAHAGKDFVLEVATQRDISATVECKTNISGVKRI
ncbi:MAG: MBL fold metallo-hydrolase [Clostridiaceae bacterium]|jgi:phosphoribosyl 1,2-cyclic phosphodiesterase|nr:MBL fold metallo-hydrolase [Clostridiaceae bacterium]